MVVACTHHKLRIAIRPLSQFIHPATFVQYHDNGNRVDRVEHSVGWHELKSFAIREGYISLAYERQYGAHSRTFQFARTMIMTGDCHTVRQIARSIDR